MPATVLPQLAEPNNNLRTAGKRKSEDVDGDVELLPTTTNDSDKKARVLQEWLKDILEILKQYDDSPSLFERKIPSSPSKPSLKRVKTTESPQTSVAENINSGSYATADEVVKDLDKASELLLQEVQEKAESGEVSKEALDKEKLRTSTLKKRLQALVVGQMFLRPQVPKLSTGKKLRHNETEASVPSTAGSGRSNRAILTLCGGDRSAKQLFSSWGISDADTSTLSDVPLPNGIATTDVIPVHSLGEEKDKVPTIGRSFPPPPNIKALDPPKPTSRHTFTRSTSINWVNPAETLITPKESNPRDPYFKQTLPTGRWLKYNAAPSTEQMSSPGSKKRHRDRALSTGEPQSAIDAETSAAYAQAKDDALFRSVYSSFAPSRDDYGAIVSQEQKNRVWWSKYGETRYQEAWNIRDDVLYNIHDENDNIEQEELDEKLLEEAISNWETDAQDIDLDAKRIPADSRGSDELLQEISELLEILNSHQRLRSLSQSTTIRPLQGQKEQLSTMPSDQPRPSSAEFEIYDNLESQLVEAISTVPPYMLAKIDGAKLGALGLSSKIKMSGIYQKGALQDDVKPRHPAAPSYSAPYPASTTVRPGYSSTPSQQYSRPGYSQTPVQRPGATTNSYSTYSARTPSAAQYTGGTARPGFSQYPQQRTASTYVDRFTSGQLGPQQTPQTYSQYGSTYRPPITQHAGSYSQQYSSPQARMLSGSAPTAQGYQPRAPPPSGTYNSAQSSSLASPNAHQNSVFGSQAGPTGQQRPALYHQHSSHYGSKSPASNPDPMNGVNATGLPNMSPVQRPGSAQRGSVTPQPLMSGQTSRQNGTPAPQQNGLAA